MKIFGKPTISVPLFYLAKGSIIACAVFPFLKNFVGTIDMNPNILYFLGIFFLALGSLFFIVSLVNLGKSTRVGIPSEDTKLKTNGLYQFSRNPMYVGVHLLCLASCMYVPNILNFIFAGLVITLHHFIILNEEKFLAERFKNDWVNYKSKVRRYL